MSIRPLTPDDLTAYRHIRTRALREHPEAFGSTAEAFALRSDDEVRSLLTVPADGSRILFGAFVAGDLAGLAMFHRSDNPKQRHRGHLFQMYVEPARRSSGLGRRLVVAVVAHARQQDGVEELRLAVTAGNDGARRLYERCGFVPTYLDPRYLKLDGRYYDSQWMSLDIRQLAAVSRGEES